MNAPLNHSVLGGLEDRILIDLVDEIAKKVQAGEAVNIEA